VLRITLVAIFLFFVFFAGVHAQAPVEEKQIVIVVASYNNAQWYAWNLDSLFCQEYKSYHIIYIDDCSTDGTYELVKEYIRVKGQENRVTLIKNERRIGALANQYGAIHMCDNTDIICICDGDDAFANSKVLKIVNTVYQDPNIWLTYGQFREVPTQEQGFCCHYPPGIVTRNAFREYHHTPSHLRTFYAGLFKHIHKKDLMDGNDFFEMTGDMAAMIPMIEMACDHYKFIPYTLYLYNVNNSISDHCKDKNMQSRIDKEIRSRPRYAKLHNPFDDTLAQYSCITKE
jgi:glycosyltransferase involved in cell wall biosynthesis